ncbi:hypothetical protein HY440_00215 [Candidatus Microgenomates bacterium]|nr:hypothetical protein [Candidatus Microgenomates bacterium]
MVVPAMNQLTGMLSKIGIIVILLYFAVFSVTRQAEATLVSVAQASVTSVDYPLPYPGMLPDSSLYFLKVWRDQAVGYLITNPVDKSFYLLFLADKRLAAGEALAEKGNVGLAATTFLKGEEYFKQAVDLASQKRNEDLLAKLVVSGAKHSEILGKESKVDVGVAYRSNAEAKKRIMELLLTK